MILYNVAVISTPQRGITNMKQDCAWCDLYDAHKGRCTYPTCVTDDAPQNETHPTNPPSDEDNRTYIL